MTDHRAAVLSELDRLIGVCEKATSGPWTIAGGNDIDDTPLIEVQGQRGRAFHLYSLKAGADVALVPFRYDANMDTSVFIVESRTFAPLALKTLKAEIERHEPRMLSFGQASEGTREEAEGCGSCCMRWPCPTIRDAYAAFCEGRDAK